MQPPDTDDGVLLGSSSRRTVNVSFTFDGTCEMHLAATKTVFPFGGGMNVQEIVIDPLNLSGLTGDEIRAAIAKRVGDLAIVSQALALASVEFETAISQATQAP